MDEVDYAEAMSDIHHAVKRSESKMEVEFSAELALKASTLTDVLRHATTLLAEEKKKGARGRMARDLALYRDVSRRAHLLNNATAPCSARPLLLTLPFVLAPLFSPTACAHAGVIRAAGLHGGRVRVQRGGFHTSA